MSTTETKNRFDVKAVRTEAERAFYAYAGVNDLAVNFVRDTFVGATKKVTGVQKDVETRVADAQKSAQKSAKQIDLAPKALAEQATGFVNTTVEALTKDAKARREAIEAKVAELQNDLKEYPAKAKTFVDGNVETVFGQYDVLVKRGETLVERLRKQELGKAGEFGKAGQAKLVDVRDDIQDEVEKVAGEVTKVVKKAASIVKPIARNGGKVQGAAAVTVADVEVATKTDEPAKKAPAKTARPVAKPAKPAAKKAPAEKAPVEKAPAKPAAKAPEKKAPAKKAPAVKETPAKAAPAKTAPAKAAPVKKAPDAKTAVTAPVDAADSSVPTTAPTAPTAKKAPAKKAPAKPATPAAEKTDN